jgi:cobalt/nickel transport system permease protein
VALGVCAAGIASSNPDGLEWSIKRLTGDIELPADADPNADAPSRRAAETIRSHTSVMPDYENRFSGLAGALLVVFVAGGVAYWIKRQKT